MQKSDCLYMKNYYCGITDWDFSWKTTFAMILVNNTKWVCSHLFGCGKTNIEPLAKGNLHHRMFITVLLLVWTVGHMDSHVTDWVSKPAQVPKDFQLEPNNLSPTP